MVERLIVGGGIHGVHLAVRLLGQARLPAEDVLLVDPEPRLLHRWHTCTRNTGMRHLRSPAVHHLDLAPWSLVAFAEAGGCLDVDPDELFTPPYARPHVELFAAHCDALIRRYGLQERTERARVVALRPFDDRVEADLDDGRTLEAREVVLALGSSDSPRWPDWGRALQRDGAPIEHVFTPGFEVRPAALAEPVAVVGAGITGAQVALLLAEHGRRVHLITRHALREHQFDSDPGWVGPKHMRGFATRPIDERRRTITAARHRGSMPPDVHKRLRAAIRREEITLVRGEVARATAGDGGVLLTIADAPMLFRSVVLCTGFEPRRPGGALVDALVAEHGLPCAACGYPIVDPALRWHPRVRVSGPLAEL